MLVRRHVLVLASGVLAPGCPLDAADVSVSGAGAEAWAVYQILQRSCTECHGGHLTKPKAKLGYILDLPRLIEEAYIAPGDPEGSDLYLALTATDEDERMPPPDSEGHRPTAAEIETIRAWIAAGAPLGGPPAADAAESSTISDSETAATGHSWPRRAGRLHPLLVHFPIALLFCACGTEIASRIRPAHATSLQAATRASLWIASVASVLAAVCGWLNAAYEGYASGEADVHRWLGVTTAFLALVALLISERAERVRSPGTRSILLAVLVACVVVVMLTGHTGGVLAFGPDYLGW